MELVGGRGGNMMKKLFSLLTKVLRSNSQITNNVQQNIVIVIINDNH